MRRERRKISVVRLNPMMQTPLAGKAAGMAVPVLLSVCCFVAFIFNVFVSNGYAVNLSVEEKGYLRTKNTIVFVSQTRYPPFEFVDADRQHEGMMLDIARWMAVEMGFKTVFMDAPFQEAQEMVLSGKADVITSLFFSDKRKERFAFTETLFDVPVSIYIRAERTDIKDIGDLNGKRIAMQKGDHAKDFLESKKIRFELFDAKDFAEATDMVIAGKADAIIGDEQIVRYHIFSNRLTDRVKKVGGPLYTGKNCMASNRDNTLLVSILNKGIDEAKKTGVLNKISTKWLGTAYGPRESFLDRYIWHFSVAAGVALLLLFWVWVWNVRLRTLVRNKTESLLESETQYRSLFENAVEGIFRTTPEGVFVSVNPSFAKIFGYGSPQELMEQVTDIGGQHYVNPEDRETFRKTLETEGVIRAFELRNHRKDGTIIWTSVNARAVEDNTGKVIYYEGTLEDITERKQAEEQIRHLATHDVLTDLPTLRLARDRLTVALGLARRNKNLAAAMFIDLDGFKAVNDTLGHDAGDVILKQVAGRILSCVRETDTVARVGGDEFLLITSALNSAENAGEIAEKVIRCVSEPFSVNGSQVTVGASIGIALYPDHGEDIDQLIKKADEAMYRIKNTGKNGFCFANPR